MTAVYSHGACTVTVQKAGPQGLWSSCIRINPERRWRADGGPSTYGKGRAVRAERWQRVPDGPGATNEGPTIGEAPMERNTVQTAQAGLLEIAGELAAIEQRLERIKEDLPESPDRDAMEEGSIPYDMPTDMRGTIECVVADDIRPAIETLTEASRVTAERLEQAWKRLLEWRQSL